MKRRSRGFWLGGLLLVHAGLAWSQTVYKWTDASGQVHYSERKDGGAVKATEIKIAPSPPPPSPEALYGQAEATRLSLNPTPPAPQTPRAPRALSSGMAGGTDAYHCALARDVLSGAVKHRNGAPTDQHDREVAQGDIQRFCR